MQKEQNLKKEAGARMGDGGDGRPRKSGFLATMVDTKTIYVIGSDPVGGVPIIKEVVC